MKKDKVIKLKNFNALEVGEVETKKKNPPPKRYYLGEKFPGLYLTQREWDSVSRIASGMTVKEAAYDLNLSARTVEFYVRTIKDKFGCRKISELRDFISKNDFLNEA